MIPALDEDAYMENNEYRETSNGSVKIWFFFTDWCPHCKKAKTPWKEFRSAIEATGVYKGHRIYFEEVDCDKDPNGYASEYDVTSYPTIKLTYNNKTYDYDAPTDKETLRKFLDTSIA